MKLSESREPSGVHKKSISKQTDFYIIQQRSCVLLMNKECFEIAAFVYATRISEF